MIYVALLRGINVGGNNKVEMVKLKALFRELGFRNVTSYINSGNIIFEDGSKTQIELEQLIESSMHKNIGFEVKVLVRDRNNILSITKTLPSTWANDQSMKCDVMFLWPNVDKANILDQLPVNPGVDEVKYTNGTILWHIDRKNATKSGAQKLVGTDLYKNMTIRNVNTVRKIALLMKTI